jgi:hypothetical protein
MIVRAPKKIEWTADDRQALDAFLRTVPGRRMLEYLAHSKPGHGDGADTGKTLVAGGVVQGYEKALDTLLGLTSERPPEAEETAKDPGTQTASAEYPDIDLPEGAVEWKGVDKPE